MTTPDPNPSHCPACGEVVGAYEPAISVTSDGTRLQGAHHGGDVAVVAVYHRDCVERAERSSRGVDGEHVARRDA